MGEHAWVIVWQQDTIEIQSLVPNEPLHEHCRHLQGNIVTDTVTTKKRHLDTEDPEADADVRHSKASRIHEPHHTPEARLCPELVHCNVEVAGSHDGLRNFRRGLQPWNVLEEKTLCLGVVELLGDLRHIVHYRLEDRARAMIAVGNAQATAGVGRPTKE